VAPKATTKERAAYADKGSTYGGITGTVSVASIARMVDALTGDGLLPQYRLNGSSVFCDIGCGTGRPTFYFAGLPIRASLGFDVDDFQVRNSMNGWRLLRNNADKISFRAPVSLIVQDALLLNSLDPVTHAYAFVGYSAFTSIVVQLAARTPSLKALCLVVLRDRELVETGLLNRETDTDVIAVGGMTMAGGRSYPGFVIPMTEARRKRVLLALEPKTKVGSKNLREIVDLCVGNPEEAFEQCAKATDKMEEGRPKRAVKRPRQEVP